ncbi:cuticle protein 21-like isoform X1 [Daphnia pulicaria]|uniref:cuticle protein 21-like isoform X1 n=1 Tax=Daphnia pulicaria TaxID=35523 RepID=UPI001EECD05F|nr:cuticle protein 21-like isoform X1 [Daphnia pulicaria]
MFLSKFRFSLHLLHTCSPTLILPLVVNSHISYKIVDDSVGKYQLSSCFKQVNYCSDMKFFIILVAFVAFAAAESYKAAEYEAPKYEAPKYEAPKYESPKYEAPKYETPKYEAPKYETPKYEAPKYEAPKYETPKYEAPKYETPKYEEVTYAPQPYSFGYDVQDKESYNDFEHNEKSDYNVVTGSYRVVLPDSRIQIVTYKADANGYTADVKYEGEAKYPEYTEPQSKADASYSAPSYKASEYQKPAYVAPAYTAPSYTTPAYKEPEYETPAYTTKATAPYPKY